MFHPPRASVEARAHQLDPNSQTITTSLATSIRHYRVENGRTYHQYKDGRKSITMELLSDLIKLTFI
jgi:hypothetical protein